MNGVAPAASADAAVSLHEVADELSSVLDRTVVISDARRCVSVRSGSSSTLTRHLRALRPPGEAAADGIEVDAPVRGSAGVLGHVLVLADAARPLPRGHLDAVDAAVALVRAVLDHHALPAPASPTLERREAVISNLPAEDATGGWLLLASSDCEPAQLRIVSPAAHALYFECGHTQRRTVETYLDVGGNVVAACELLFVHRTTLYYRLEKMPQVVRDALADGMARSTLHLSLKMIRLWEADGRI